MSNRREFLQRGWGLALSAAIPASVQSIVPVRQIDPRGTNGHRLPTRVRGNPIVRGVGLCDPHLRVFEGKVYLYATHDASPLNSRYTMYDWWVWSSEDMVNWQLASVLAPEQTFLGSSFDQCWAVDAATRNGRYYLYFSAGPEQIGVVSSETPHGPWVDPLKKPLLAKGFTPTEERDPGILMDDDETAYIVFGAFDYFIAKLNEDMVSLAEEPRLLVLDRKVGPYGEGRTGDKPYLHRRHDRYYLSWGCFYAMADNPYGPFVYKGPIITAEMTAPEFRSQHLLNDRHSSFCEFNGRWFFSCNDYSQPGTTAWFRDSILCYLNYRDNGDIAPVRIDSIGVGRYDAAGGPIQAEDYFKLQGPGSVRDLGEGFEVRGLEDGSTLFYPNIENVPTKAKVILRLSSNGAVKARIDVHEGAPTGPQLGTAVIKDTGSWSRHTNLEVPLSRTCEGMGLVFVFHGRSGEIARLESWTIASVR